MSSTEEWDWIFDFVLQFLESDKFDSSVMNFVDERCHLFEDVDENKLEYTSIHHEFCDYVELLLSSNLNELGINTDVFLESCTKARSARDINNTVYERLVAMDDFSTFKKIMVNRNTFLQAEALSQLAEIKKASGKNTSAKASDEKSSSKATNDYKGGGYDSKNAGNDSPKFFQYASEKEHFNLPDPEELHMLKDQEFDWDAFEQLEDEDIQDFLFQSLMEMELIHRQEELEHAELERALTMSLALEEERLRDLMEEIQNVRNDMDEIRSMHNDSVQSDAKYSSSAPTAKGEAPQVQSKELPSSPGAEAGSSAAADAKKSPSSRPSFKAGSSPGVAVDATKISDPKPLKGFGLGTLGSKPLPGIKAALPAIGKSAAFSDLTKYSEELSEKKKMAEEQINRNKEQLASQRVKEEELRQQLNGVDPKEAERRAEHMKAQRDLIIQKKKEERDKKVQREAEWRQKSAADDEDMIAKIQDSQLAALSSSGGDAKSAEEKQAEQRRSTMRTALARRMKSNVSDSMAEDAASPNRAKGSMNVEIDGEEGTLAELEKIGRRFEQFHEDNRKREYILMKQLERQQAQIARNVKLSAANMDGD